MKLWPGKKKNDEPTLTVEKSLVSRKDLAGQVHDRLSRLRPMCDVCNKLVDGMTEIPTVEPGAFKYIVDCHGDTEDFVLTAEMARSGVVKGARAFVGKTREMAGRDDLKPKDLILQHRKELGLPNHSLIEGTSFKRIKIRYEDVRCQVVFIAEPYAMQGAESVHNRDLLGLLKNPFVVCYIHPHPGGAGNIHIVMRVPTQSVVTLDALTKGATGDSMWGEVVWNQIAVVKDTFTFYNPRKTLLKWIAKGLIGEEDG